MRFLDLGDIYINYATLKQVEKLASHVFFFLVKSIVNLSSYCVFLDTLFRVGFFYLQLSLR